MIEQDAYWHLRVMLLSGLIIPIVPASQIFTRDALIEGMTR